MSEERSIADKPELDDTAEVERADLTVDEFLSGVRKQRRAVKIRPNLHVLADMQRLVDVIDDTPDGEDVDGLIDEYEAAKETFLAHEWWVVEQRTPERRREVRRSAAKRLGIEMHADGENVREDDPDQTNAAALEAHVIADHVVQPEGVTAEQVRALYEGSPGEYTKVDHAVARVMRVLDEEAAQGVLRDFSSRRSVKTGRS